MPQYYIALLAPEEINKQVLTWKNYMQQQYGCKTALKSPAHITMIPPFIMHEEKEKDLHNALTLFAKRPPLEVQLKNFASFEPRVIYVDVVPNDALQQCKTELDDFLLPKTQFPIKKENRPFRPHITIANRDIPINSFDKAWEYFQAQQFEADFTVPGLTLMKYNPDNWEKASMAAFQP